MLVVEALDRLSRDMEDLEGLHKRLSFQGIEIRAVHEGAVNTVLVGLRGLMGQMYREDNAHKVRRGHAGRVRDGLSGGGLTYGYAPVPGQVGKRVIVENEADVVRRISRNTLLGARRATSPILSTTKECDRRAAAPGTLPQSTAMRGAGVAFSATSFTPAD